VRQLIAAGQCPKAIAAGLGVSVKTVETFRRQLMDKLGIDSIAGLTKYAVRTGLVSVGRLRPRAHDALRRKPPAVRLVSHQPATPLIPQSTETRCAFCCPRVWIRAKTRCDSGSP
jgi:hypothetical protein